MTEGSAVFMTAPLESVMDEDYGSYIRFEPNSLDDKVFKICSKFFKQAAYRINIELVKLFHKKKFSRISCDMASIDLDIDGEEDNYLTIQINISASKMLDLDLDKIFEKITHNLSLDMIGFILTSEESHMVYDQIGRKLILKSKFKYELSID